IVVAAGEDDAAVLGAERLVGNDVRVQVADPLGRFSRREIVGVLVREQRDLRVEEREIELLPDTALLAVRKRGADRDRGVHPGDDVGDGNAGALRPAARRIVGLAGDAHHPAHALDHEVVAGALAVRAGLAEARDRAVDEARIDLLQVFVGKAVAREVAELVVLDEHVRDLRELARELLPLGLGDVERDRFLAAVGRGVVGRVLAVAPVPVLHPGRTESARVVARARTLDLDHVGAEIGEVLPRPGAGEHARKIEYADVREPVWLEAPRTEKFLGIYTEAKSAKGAIILAHGLGVHPDYGLIGELRTRLADAGYATLSIQMPILSAEAPPARYPVLFWEADARFAAAMTYLKRKRYERVVLLSHSMGSRMANHYVGAHPLVPLAGWISLSISSGEFAPIK